MIYNPDIHDRKSYRLPGWDYSAGGIYFITICSRERECIWGEIKDDEMVWNVMGALIDEELEESFKIRQELDSYYWVVMPNHLHALIHLRNSEKRGFSPQNIKYKKMRPKSLSSFVAGFKSHITRRIGHSIWQKGFHDHHIRNEKEYIKKQEYILNNPKSWDEDEHNPINF